MKKLTEKEKNIRAVKNVLIGSTFAGFIGYTTGSYIDFIIALFTLSWINDRIDRVFDAISDENGKPI